MYHSLELHISEWPLGLYTPLVLPHTYEPLIQSSVIRTYRMAALRLLVDDQVYVMWMSPSGVCTMLG